MKTVIVLDVNDIMTVIAKHFDVAPGKVAFSVNGDYTCDWIGDLECGVEIECDKAVK